MSGQTFRRDTECARAFDRKAQLLAGVRGPLDAGRGFLTGKQGSFNRDLDMNDRCVKIIYIWRQSRKGGQEHSGGRYGVISDQQR